MTTEIKRALTATQFEGMFPDEAARKAYLLARRWPEGVHCPRCGNPEVYAVKARTWAWQCERCAPSGYRFPITTGTIFEKTNRPLRDWYRLTCHKVRTILGVGPTRPLASPRKSPAPGRNDPTWSPACRSGDQPRPEASSR